MDKILITMPSNPREFFLAMPVIQDYIFRYVHEVSQNKVDRTFRDPQFHFTFRMDEAFEEFALPLKVAKNIDPDFDYTGWTKKYRSEFQCFIDFNFADAEKIALNTGKHITETLGLMIGSTPRKWPLIPPISQDKFVLLLNWDGTPLMEEAVKLQNMMSEEEVDAVNLKEPIGMDDIKLLDLSKIKAVIGPASAFTYLAAAYNRTVIEIFPDKKSYVLYNNQGLANYQPIIGNPGAETVLSAWNNLHQTGYEHLDVGELYAQ